MYIYVYVYICVYKSYTYMHICISMFLILYKSLHTLFSGVLEIFE